MPKIIPVEKNNNKYSYMTIAHVNLKKGAILSLPLSIGKEVQDKKVKVTIEVLE